MIKALKLVTGEEVVGKITYLGGNDILVEKPCAMMLVSSRSTPDKHSMALVPYAGYAKDHNITIDKTHVVWQAELADDVYNQYNSIFGTGIQIVSGPETMSPSISQLNVVSA